MDYEVFLLSRIQEAFWQTGDNTQSVALGLQRSGGIITSAAIIVIVVSACFATADMILVKALGLGMALAVLIDATLVRGLLVPATMRLLGKWNWWLPFVGIQRHPPALAEHLGLPDSVKDHSCETAISVVENMSMEGGKR
jgi:RND superfamily putative drug exporter